MSSALQDPPPEIRCPACIHLQQHAVQPYRCQICVHMILSCVPWEASKNPRTTDCTNEGRIQLLSEMRCQERRWRTVLHVLRSLAGRLGCHARRHQSESASFQLQRPAVCALHPDCPQHAERRFPEAGTAPALGGPCNRGCSRYSRSLHPAPYGRHKHRRRPLQQ